MASNIDEALATGLKTAKTKRMYFAVVLKGGADGALIVSKTKVPPGDIAEAKKKSGGSAVLKGLCFGEDGQLVFEMAKEPPATLARALKLIAKRDANLVISPVCRSGTDPELLDGPPPPTDAAEWEKEFAAIQSKLKQALAANSPASKEIKLRFSEAQSYKNRGDFKTARATLKIVDQLIAKAPGQSAPDPKAKPDPKATPDPKTAPDPKAKAKPPLAGRPARTAVLPSRQRQQFQQRTTALTNKLKKVLAGKSPAAAKISAAFKKAVDAANKGKYGPAFEDLAKIESQVDTALASPDAGAPGAPEPDSSPDPKSPAADPWTNRLNRMTGDLKEVRAASPDFYPKIRNLLIKARRFGEADDKKNAGATLDIVGALIAKVLNRPDPDAATKQSEAKKFSAALVRWNVAVKDIFADLQRLQGTIRGSYPQESASAAQITLLMRKFPKSLTTTLRAGAKAKNAKAREANRATALKSIRRLRATIAADPLIKVVDNCPFEKLGLQARLTSVISDLQTQLSPA